MQGNKNPAVAGVLLKLELGGYGWARTTDPGIMSAVL
jgi:hypothetical protein